LLKKCGENKTINAWQQPKPVTVAKQLMQGYIFWQHKNQVEVLILGEEKNINAIKMLVHLLSIKAADKQIAS